jgi:hypothetical protein
MVDSTTPVKKSFKTHVKEIFRAIASAVVSPTVVPIEKKLAVFVLTRGLLAAGASAGLISVLVKVLGG